MPENKKKKNGLWSKMKKVVKTKGNDNPIKNQTGYKNYVISGGTSDFQTWQKENKQ